jgi:hypothetical protein
MLTRMCAAIQCRVCSNALQGCVLQNALTVKWLRGRDQASSLCAEWLAVWQCWLKKLCVGFPGAAVPWSSACGQLAVCCSSLTPSTKVQPCLNQAAVACSRPLCSFQTSCTAVCTCLICPGNSDPMHSKCRESLHALCARSARACRNRVPGLPNYGDHTRLAPQHMVPVLGLKCCKSGRHTRLHKCVLTPCVTTQLWPLRFVAQSVSLRGCVMPGHLKVFVERTRAVSMC